MHRRRRRCGNTLGRPAETDPSEVRIAADKRTDSAVSPFRLRTVVPESPGARVYYSTGRANRAKDSANTS